jgi:hypothetical protein
MAAYNIPLDVKSPQIENPFDVYSRVLQNRNLMQQGQLHQAQLEQYGLENQQRTESIQSQKDLADLLAKNTTIGPDGSSTTDHAAVMQGLAQRGHGAEALKYDADRRANQTAMLANTATKLENAKRQLDELGSLSGSVLNAPDDQKEAAFQNARSIAIEKGFDQPQNIPPSWAQGGQAYIQQHQQTAIGASQSVDQNLKHMDYLLARDKFQNDVNREKPDTIKKWLDVTGQLAKSVSDQTHWTNLIDTLTQEGAPKEVLDMLPKTYSLEAASTASEMAITPEQRARNKETEQSRQAALDLRKDLGQQSLDLRKDLGQQNIELRREVQDNKPETPSQKRTRISRLADQALKLSARGASGGGGLDQAIQDVGNPNLYNDHPVGDDRGEVIAELQRRKAQAAPETRTDRHRSQISQMADQAVQLSAQGGGGGLDQELADVQNTDLYKDHAIGQNRGEVAKELENRQAKEADIRSKQNANPAPVKPVAPKQAPAPAPQAPQQAAPAAPQQAPPPPKAPDPNTGKQPTVSVRLPDGPDGKPRYISGPKDKIDAMMKENGLTYK